VLNNTAFRDCNFEDCKMLGLHFENCNVFGLQFSFTNCILDHSVFYKIKIKGTHFRNSRLYEVDFTECDLTASIFENCDLKGASFGNTLLKKADFRSSYNYSLDPETNKIEKAKFSIPAVLGLLNKYNIEIEV
jgi:uncharacterized protein YjbI with pentapeptide repeats